MFHHRSIGFPGRVGGNINTAQNVLSSQRQNENLIHRGNNQLKPSGTNNNMNGKNAMVNTSKTPAGKKGPNRRRALGDISNKKGSGFGQESSTKQKPQPQQNDVLKPRSTNLLPRAATRNVPSTQKTSFSLLSEQSKPSQPQLVLKQPINNRSAIGQPSFSVTTSQVKTRPLKEEPYPDIELPAGRTWKQQLEYDLKDEDDIASTSSMDSILNLEGCLSPQARWENWRESHFKRQKEEADKEDRQVQEQIQAMMDREQEEADNGIDSLYEIIDNLDILSDDNLEIDKNNSLLEEEWSIPASSACDLNTADDLLFPL